MTPTAAAPTPDDGLRIDRPNDLVRSKVVRALRQAILDGRFVPGQHLTERELTELTGVSRTSIREALRHLETEGLVEHVMGKGTRVRTLTHADIDNIYDVRAALEATAASLFAIRASDTEMAALVELMSREAPDFELGPPRIFRFYEALMTGAANPILQSMLGSLHLRIHALRSLSLAIPGRREAAIAEMAALLRAIEAREPVAAADAARAHVLGAKAAAHEAITRVEEERNARRKPTRRV